MLCPNCAEHHSPVEGDISPLLEYSTDAASERRRTQDASSSYYGGGVAADEAGAVSDDSILFDGRSTPPNPYADLPNYGHANNSGIAMAKANFPIGDQSSAAIQVRMDFCCLFMGLGLWTVSWGFKESID